MSDDEAVKLAREALKVAYPETDSHHDLARAVLSQHEEIERLRRMVSKLEIDRGFYENEIDAKRLVLASDVAADRDRLRAALAEALSLYDEKCIGCSTQTSCDCPSGRHLNDCRAKRIAEMRREWKL